MGMLFQRQQKSYIRALYKPKSIGVFTFPVAYVILFMFLTLSEQLRERMRINNKLGVSGQMLFTLHHDVASLVESGIFFCGGM